MAHFGVLSYKGTGHLNPLITLSQGLIARGHGVTFFLPPELESRIRLHGIDFFPMDLSEIAPARHRKRPSSRSKPEWAKDMRARLQRIGREIRVYMRVYAAAIRKANVDVLIMGEITLAGPTVAQLLDIPYVVISTSIPHNFGWDAPRSLLPQRTWREALQAKIFEVSIFHMKGPVRRILDRYRSQAGLGPVSGMGTAFPELAHITQWPQCLSKPRQELPDRFFYTGPFVSGDSRSQIDFPWHKLNCQPVVYASLGTTLKADPNVYHCIAAACVGLDVQLVITLGGRRNPEDFAELPGNPLVVENAPQLDLLKRAEIVITHAGPNTALETLLQGKPMLCMPIALDQPAVADHLQCLGVAEVLSAQQRSIEEIRAALLKLMSEARYREAAREIQAQLQSLEGVTQAAILIENALSNHRQPA